MTETSKTKFIVGVQGDPMARVSQSMRHIDSNPVLNAEAVGWLC